HAKSARPDLVGLTIYYNAGLRQNSLYRLGRIHIRQLLLPAIVGERQPFKIQAEQMQQRSVQIRHRHNILHSAIAEFIRSSVAYSALYSASCDPQAEASLM